MKRPALFPVRLPSSDDPVLATMDAPPAVLVLLIARVVFLLPLLLLLLLLLLSSFTSPRFVSRSRASSFTCCAFPQSRRPLRRTRVAKRVIE